MIYRAWVPTVSGRLSFKIVGEARYPTKADYANVSTDTHQYVLVSQARNLSDVLFEWILGPLFGISGQFTFFYCARMRRDNGHSDTSLVGRVYVARRYKSGDPKFKKILERIRPVDLRDADSSGRKIYCEALEALERYCDISASAVLHRDGTVGISHVRWHDDQLRTNSLTYADERVVDIDHSIADQIYFFIRDICHQHQHHGADADTIITTQKAEGEGLFWANNIVYALYLYMINAKRRDDNLEHVRVLGVLAYVKAFKHIVNLRAFQRGLEPSVPDFNDDAMAESINATRSYIELLQARARQRSDLGRTVLFAIIAALFSWFTFMSSFADPDVKAPQYMIDLANLTKSNAYWSAAPVVVMVIWWLSSKLSRERYDFKRDVLRVAFVSRVPFAIGAFALSVLLGYLAWQLFVMTGSV